jgi:hypothetical protein
MDEVLTLRILDEVGEAPFSMRASELEMISKRYHFDLYGDWN